MARLFPLTSAKKSCIPEAPDGPVYDDSPDPQCTPFLHCSAGLQDTNCIRSSTLLSLLFTFWFLQLSSRNPGFLSCAYTSVPEHNLIKLGCKPIGFLVTCFHPNTNENKTVTTDWRTVLSNQQGKMELQVRHSLPPCLRQTPASHRLHHPYLGAKIKLEFADVFLSYAGALHPLGLHCSIKHGCDLQQLFHCVPVRLVELLGIEFYMCLCGLFRDGQSFALLSFFRRGLTM